MDEVVIHGCLCHCKREVDENYILREVEFKILNDRRKTATKTLTLDMGKADFRLFGELVGKVP